jgi:hypothetical protein
MEMSLAECVDEEGQGLLVIGRVFRDLINSRDYLGLLVYYFVLGKEQQELVRNNERLNAMLDLDIDEAPYQKLHY